MTYMASNLLSSLLNNSVNVKYSNNIVYEYSETPDLNFLNYKWVLHTHTHTHTHTYTYIHISMPNTEQDLW
jgi:hypothetical protein